MRSSARQHSAQVRHVNDRHLFTINRHSDFPFRVPQNTSSSQFSSLINLGFHQFYLLVGAANRHQPSAFTGGVVAPSDREAGLGGPGLSSCCVTDKRLLSLSEPRFLTGK